MRKFLCFAILALSGAAFAQDAKVTYTSVAVSAKQAIADLAQKTGRNIHCSPAMDNEILILRLQDAPVDQVLAQIATVTSGTWRQEGEINYLVPNANARSLEGARVQQRLADKITVSLTKMQKAMEARAKASNGGKPGAGDVGGADLGGVMFGMSDSEAMVKLALSIGANQLASVPEDGRMVFSSNPTRMQRSLPAGASAIIDQFVVEYNKTAAAASQNEPAKEDQDENMKIFMELFGSKLKKPKPITTAPAKAIVVASRRGMFMGFTLQLKLYDANGKVLATNTLPLVTDMPFNMEDLTKPKTPPKSQGKEIQLSPLAQEMYAASNSLSPMGGAAYKKFSKELLEALRDPVAHDPLSYVHSEALIATAQERNEQLVADLPDGVVSLFGNLVAKGSLTADSFLKDIKGDDKAAVQEANGWLIVSPDNPVKSRKQRTDRYALRTLIQSAQAAGYASLDAISAFATKNESPIEGAPASATYVMIFAPGAVQQGMMGTMNWDVVRLYGMLGTSQRDALRQGGRLVFGQLSPAQQNLVSKMLFGASASLTIENRDPNAKKQDPLTEMITAQIERFSGGNESDYRTEPTEVMPGGLPSDGYIQGAVTSEPIGQPQTMSTDFGRMSTVGPMELGLFKFFKEDPNMSQISGQMPTLDDLKVGSRTVIDLSFYVAPVVCQKETLNDDLIPKDAQVYKLNNLPPDFQKRIDDMAASMKKNPIWSAIAKMGGFGQKGAPPQ